MRVLTEPWVATSWGVLAQEAALAGVGPFGVLADDDEVAVGGAPRACR